MYSDFCILFHSVFLCPAFQNRRHWTHKLALHLRGSSPWSAHTRMESNSFHWDSIKSHPLMPRLRVKNRKPVSTHLSSAGSPGRRTDSQNDFSQIQLKKPQPIDYLFTHLQVDQNTWHFPHGSQNIICLRISKLIILCGWGLGMSSFKMTQKHHKEGV